MFRHGHARRAVLLLMVLAAAFMWAADPGLRAAAADRAETGATAATGAAPAVAAEASTAEPQEAAKPTATQKAQQTTITDAAGRKHTYMKKVTPEQRQAAADRLKAKAAAAGLAAPATTLKAGALGMEAAGGITPMAAFPAMPGALIPPGEPGSQYLVGPEGQLVPDYSGLTANWAYSPTPTTIVIGGSGPPISVGSTLIDRYWPSDGDPKIFGVVSTPLPNGRLQSFQTFNAPGSGGGVFHAYVLRPTGALNQYSVEFDSGPLTVPTVAVGTIQDFPIPGGVSVIAGDVIAWYGTGIPYDVFTGEFAYYPVYAPPTQGASITLGDSADFPVYPQLRTYSFGATIIEGSTEFTGGIRKFVDTLPGVNAPNNLGQQIPLAVADTTTYPGSDYYEIELGEYSEKMHSDLPPTRLRGYRQTNGPAGMPFHYLGPLVVAQKGRPVRVKFTNNLPTGAAGNLFIPVDASVMGAGPGSLVGDVERLGTPENVRCKTGPGQEVLAGCYTQNRATIHLHGGVTPWISDGTTHQWITPAGTTEYPKGVSVYNVPDMPNPGKPDPAAPSDGVMTFYYTNDQSARLMFYHDHAHGITRLNVYAGAAAGYLLTDDTEAALVSAGLLPDLLGPYHIPLIIQDKTFVDAENIRVQDPTWNWGTGEASLYDDGQGGTMQLRAPNTGDLWWPHVYQPAQNPYDLSGYNATGRWNYGPWFYPPTTGIMYQPVTNPYLGLNDLQPPLVPGTPNPSWGAEAFLDTPVINGTAYPTLTVAPRAYRFRILNAAHDRFWNLQLYKADTSVPPGCPTCASETEVKMVPASPANDPPLPDNWPQDGRPGGVPDPATAGPNWIVIGSEGGFLPRPAVVPPQPTVWNADPLTFNFGNVSDFSLLVAPAERADVIVDFSGFAGQTLILYNDAPAAFPASDPRNDYFTGNGDQFDTGGTGSTLPGFGPNTRTLMQIKVGTEGVEPYSVENLMTAWMPGQTVLPFTPAGVFEHGQDPIIVGQGTHPDWPGYNGVYSNNPTFPSTAPYWGLGSIFDTDVYFETVAGDQIKIAAGEKAIQDEMGETFDEYGRMKSSLGVSRPIKVVAANFIQQGYADPPTEIVQLSGIGTPIGDPLLDGTQIWRITQNGVDTHPVHFHLFHVQLLNRVGWDGAYRLPREAEIGWKDTVRISPLEDTYVALRPIVPRPETLPWKVPNSFRPLEPALPLGSTLSFNNIDPNGNPITPGITNEVHNFGWEYIWHCHILSHEENDMMRAIVFSAPPEASTGLGLAGSRTAAGVPLQWLDNSVSATSFSIQRATDAGFTAGLTSFTVPVQQCDSQDGCARTYTDTSANPVVAYYYRVQATNTVGSSVPNYPYLTSQSAWSPEVGGFLVAAIAAPNVNTPTNLAAQIISATQIRLTWTDTSNNENNFRVWRSVNGAAFTQFATVTRTTAQRTATGGTVTFNNTGLSAGNTYAYYVVAWNTVPNPDTSSADSATVAISLTAPEAPTLLEGFGFVVPALKKDYVVALSWVDNATNETSYQVQRCSGTCTGASTWTSLTPLLPADETAFSEIRKKNTTWSYRVRATNAVGNSAFSNIATVITP